MSGKTPLGGWKFYAVGLVRRMWRSNPGFFMDECVVTPGEMQQEGCNEQHGYLVRVTKILDTTPKTPEGLPGKAEIIAGMAGYVEGVTV